jgi:hypothetical protein
MCQPAPRAEGSPCRNLPIGAAARAQQARLDEAESANDRPCGKGFGTRGSRSGSGTWEPRCEVLALGSLLGHGLLGYLAV